jgi:hypothetical protein
MLSPCWRPSSEPCPLGKRRQRSQLCLVTVFENRWVKWASIAVIASRRLLSEGGYRHSYQKTDWLMRGARRRLICLARVAHLSRRRAISRASPRPPSRARCSCASERSWRRIASTCQRRACAAARRVGFVMCSQLRKRTGRRRTEKVARLSGLPECIRSSTAAEMVPFIQY